MNFQDFHNMRVELERFFETPVSTDVLNDVPSCLHALMMEVEANEDRCYRLTTKLDKVANGKNAADTLFACVCLVTSIIKSIPMPGLEEAEQERQRKTMLLSVTKLLVQAGDFDESDGDH